MPRAILDQQTGMPQPRLSEEQLHLLAFLATGMTVDAAARALGVSGRTIRRRMRTICELIGVDTPIQAVTWAARRDLL